MASAANNVISLIALGALAFGAHHVAPEETRAFAASAVDLVKGVANSLPAPGDSTMAEGGDEGLNLPSISELLSATPASDPTDFSFLASDPSGTPVRWDPCTAIPVIVNADRAPAGALEEVQTALTQINATTGLNFTYTGTTSAIPQNDWYAQSWPGATYPPVIVAWASPSESNMLTSGDESGRATANPALINGESRYVTGAVILNTEHNDLYSAGFGDGRTRGTLLLHELSHVVGLDHADGRGEIMHPELGSFTPGTFSSGDLSGLGQLGAARGCAA